jgi:nucleoside-diphosphate-sugar epimerase
MRILVTGVAGFVGSHLAEGLLAAGHEVVGLDAFIDYYPRALKERNLEDLRRHAAFDFHELDLRSDSLDSCLEGIEVVVNEAAMAGLMRSWQDLEAYTSCNILAVNRLAEAAVRAGVGKFLHVSTSSVYGMDAVGDEDQPLQPISPYGVTKLAAENLVLAHVRSSGLPASILRYFSIYGPRQRPDMAYRIFIGAMLDGHEITVYGDGRQSRSNTFISDCVRGTIQAIEGAQVGEIYNIGGGQEIALAEAIDLIADATGASPRIRREPPRPGDQRRTWADTGKARTAFGYQPTVTPEVGLREQVAWQTEQGAEETAERS